MSDFLEYIIINIVSFYGLRLVSATVFIALVFLGFYKISKKSDKTEEEWKNYIIKNIKNRKIIASGMLIYFISMLMTFFTSILWFKVLKVFEIRIPLDNILPIVIPALIFLFTCIKFFQNKDEFIEELSEKLQSLNE